MDNIFPAPIHSAGVYFFWNYLRSMLCPFSRKSLFPARCSVYQAFLLIRFPDSWLAVGKDDSYSLPGCSFSIKVFLRLRDTFTVDPSFITR